MADRADIQPENVEGKYYVDEQCIDCDLCREEAPKNFTRQEEEGYSYVYKQPENEEEGYSYVYKQPENEEEEADCQNAMDNCPVEAIGNDV